MLTTPHFTLTENPSGLTHLASAIVKARYVCIMTLSSHLDLHCIVKTLSAHSEGMSPWLRCLPHSIFPGILRTLFAAFYVVLFTVLGGKFPTEYVASAEYAVSCGLRVLLKWG